MSGHSNYSTPTCTFHANLKLALSRGSIFEDLGCSCCWCKFAICTIYFGLLHHLHQKSKLGLVHQEVNANLSGIEDCQLGRASCTAGTTSIDTKLEDPKTLSFKANATTKLLIFSQSTIIQIQITNALPSSNNCSREAIHHQGFLIPKLEITKG